MHNEKDWMTAVGDQPESLMAEMIHEEMSELGWALTDFHEFSHDDPSSCMDVLKEMCDVLFTIKCYCLKMGWDFDGAYQDVIDSNMSKTVDGTILRRADGKILKGPNYDPPHLERFI